MSAAMAMTYTPHPPEKAWLVQKYGGTSLGKQLPSIANEILLTYFGHNKLAIVCSAISGQKKSNGTTSLLLEAIDVVINKATSEDVKQYEVDRIVSTIWSEHVKVLESLRSEEYERGNDALIAAKRVIKAECDGLSVFLLNAVVETELTHQARDRVIATGEKLSCILVVAALQQQGAPAELVTLDDIVQAAYGTSSSAQKAAWENLGPRFFDPLATEIGKRVLRCGEKIPVVPGFFGSMPEPLITSVGRGYTDLCAAMCAAGLESHELQIWKEVDGIFTADPRKVKGARLLATVTMEEARELTECGSEVIHPFTMDQVNKARMPLRLKNVGNPEGPGTIIYPSSWVSEDVTPVVAGETAKVSIISTEISEFMAKNGYDGETQSRRMPTALTSKDSVVLVHVQSFREKKSHDFLAHVFKTLDEEKVDTDLVSTSQQSVSIALAGIKDRDDATLQRVLAKLGKCGKPSVEHDMSIVSVIGQSMRNMVGIAAQIFKALADVKVNFHLISQGASEINISFVVKANEAQLALETCHERVLGIPHQNNVVKGLVIGPWLY